jgi:hypothetical protein
MLRIRQAQIKVFQPQAEAGFVSRMTEYLREHHRDVVVKLPSGDILVREISDERLRKMVENAIARARGYAMNWESSLGAFVVLMFVTAPNFDRHPLIHRVMSDENIAPDSRIGQLWERTTDENWKAVKKSYDANAWDLEL